MKLRKRRKPPSAHTPKDHYRETKHLIPADMVAMSTEQAKRTEINEKPLTTKERRRNGKLKSKQPPLSEEMKSVTEIGSGRWKPGQTK